MARITKRVWRLAWLRALAHQRTRSDTAGEFRARPMAGTSVIGYHGLAVSRIVIARPDHRLAHLQQRSCYCDRDASIFRIDKGSRPILSPIIPMIPRGA